MQIHGAKHLGELREWCKGPEAGQCPTRSLCGEDRASVMMLERELGRGRGMGGPVDFVLNALKLGLGPMGHRGSPLRSPGVAHTVQVKQLIQMPHLLVLSPSHPVHCLC